MPFINTIAGLAVIAFLITLVMIPALIAFTARMNWLDTPDQRKEHRFPVPTMGGLAVFAGAAGSLLLFMPDTDTHFGLLS